MSVFLPFVFWFILFHFADSLMCPYFLGLVSSSEQNSWPSSTSSSSSISCVHRQGLVFWSCSELAVLVNKTIFSSNVIGHARPLYTRSSRDFSHDLPRFGLTCHWHHLHEFIRELPRPYLAVPTPWRIELHSPGPLIRRFGSTSQSVVTWDAHVPSPRAIKACRHSGEHLGWMTLYLQ